MRRTPLRSCHWSLRKTISQQSKTPNFRSTFLMLPAGIPSSLPYGTGTEYMGRSRKRFGLEIFMKGFERKNQLLSLCGLNCGLCPMLLGNHCGGCGNGNQSCRIAKCSLNHGGVKYCYECIQYPCETYQHIDEYDSFITHRRQTADLEKAKNLPIFFFSNLYHPLSVIY